MGTLNLVAVLITGHATWSSLASALGLRSVSQSELGDEAERGQMILYINDHPITVSADLAEAHLAAERLARHRGEQQIAADAVMLAALMETDTHARRWIDAQGAAGTQFTERVGETVLSNDMEQGIRAMMGRIVDAGEPGHAPRMVGTNLTMQDLATVRRMSKGRRWATAIVIIVLLLVGTITTGPSSALSAPARVRTYLGVSLSDQSDGDVVVTQVGSGTPAATAGLTPGDVLIRFDGIIITDSQQLIALVQAHHPGDKVILVVRHDGRLATLTVTLN